MRVIIPAAGEGKRFKDAGYNTKVIPKPLILVNGRPMLDHVLRRVEDVDSQPLVLTRAEHSVLMAARMDDTPLMVDVRYPQQGAALTLLCANGHVRDDEPVMVVACDDMVKQSEFNLFASFAAAKAQAGAGTVMTMLRDFSDSLNNTSPFSHVHGAGGAVGYIAEKRIVSDRICCGAYVFPSWEVLREGICRMVAAGDTVNGEYYISTIYNHYHRYTYYFDIPADAFRTVGTPEALKAYEEELRARR